MLNTAYSSATESFITNWRLIQYSTMWPWKILGFFGLFVLCSAKQRLLVDQLRWELLELENELRQFSRIVLANKTQEGAELFLALKFNTFDQNLTKIPENRLYGTEAIRQFPQFLFLFSELNDIYNTYEKFRDYLKQTLNGTRFKIAIEDLNYDITNGKTGVLKAIERVNDLAYKDMNNIREKINDVEMFEKNYWCKNTKQSPQQVSYNFYNLIALAQLKAYVLQQFSLLGNMLWDEYDVSTKSSLQARRSFEKNAIHLMGTGESSSDIWRCDPEQFIKGVNYDTFTRLLQGHIQNEVDMSSLGTCTETCEAYSHAKSYGCYDGESDVCKKTERCYGDLHECSFVESHASICVSDDASRRYRYVQYDSGQMMGDFSYCSSTRYAYSWSRWFVRCHYCMCLCDQQGANSDRHINLRPVFADFKNNRIVTGLKLEKHNRLLHLKIQEGQLLPYGYINQSTVHWVDVDDYAITDQGVTNQKDYYTMTYGHRSMALDDITVHDDNHVLTGVRFTVKNHKIHFYIHVSPFDWHTGRVEHEDGYYIYETSVQDRSEIRLDDADIPIKTTQPSRMVTFDEAETLRYVPFTHTSFTKDAAQTTIPYIDIQPVINEPAVPLVGAGIYYKGAEGFGGFIAPKIKTYDFGRHASIVMPLVADNIENIIPEDVEIN